MPGKKKIVYTDWKEWENQQSFPTTVDTEFRHKRASVPLVFVPGIMGSRLRKKNGDTAWDPNSKAWMAFNLRDKSGKHRKELLIDDPLEVISIERAGEPVEDFREMIRTLFSTTHWVGSTTYNPPKWDWLGIPPDSPAETRFNTAVDTIMRQGWEEIAWEFYGPIMLRLSETDFGDRAAFMHPVYACGYNWIDDNLNGGEHLAKRITKIIAAENAKIDRECHKVIVVSHSMGGLVSRAAAVLGSSEPEIVGIIHGAQPATGAPAAYRRMRAGFENASGSFMDEVQSMLLGWDNSKVVPVLANCIGGLELLPTKQYTVDREGKEKTWLKLFGKDHKRPSEVLPTTGNPYEEIYRLGPEFLRLVNHPELLDPGAEVRSKRGRYGRTPTASEIKFTKNIGAAETFHDDLDKGKKVHDQTFVTYTSHNGPGTFHEIRYKYLRGRDETETLFDESGNSFEAPKPPENEGSGIDLDVQPPDKAPPQYFKIDAGDGPGDGTVPVSSGAYLERYSKNDALRSFAKAAGQSIVSGVPSIDHAHFYNQPEAIDFTVAAIRYLQQLYRKSVLGR